MTEHHERAGRLPDELAEYLQTFLDETEEQLDDLVETMLALERDAGDRDHLNEAFRLIHSIKGSAGMMGFDNITVLTHQLENRFERFRSGVQRLDEPTTSVVLRCIDFLRQCNNRLREGRRLGSAAELLEELRRVEEQGAAAADRGDREAIGPVVADAAPPPRLADETLESAAGDSLTVIVVRFRPGLQLADLKAQLILARLSQLGEIKSTRPAVEQLSDMARLEMFTVYLESPHGWERLRAAADVDGVESIDFPGDAPPPSTAAGAPAMPEEAAAPEVAASTADNPATDAGQPSDAAAQRAPEPPPAETAVAPAPGEIAAPVGQPALPSAATVAPAASATVPSEPPMAEKAPGKVVETMRVDIDRLDNLLNLAGELVVNRARFVQIAEQLSPALRKGSMVNRIREFGDSLRRAIERMEHVEDVDGEWMIQIQQLRAGLDLMEEQSDVWDNGRRCFGQISEAIDQLSRVSQSLQRGVLDTRMVPVGPLFNRFKRVVRDLSAERNKQVNLLIRGEKTELDKRMIDELGDPLVHLVRNSIDHGLEPTAVRVSQGKSEVGSICLEASHRGNHVYIVVQDDGGGINVPKIKAKLIANGILSEAAAARLADTEAIEYIWHPGFSTAQQVTDVSGRGVGMDVVKTRIQKLNGSIDVASTPQRGTTFTIRLPLTLAIIDCLLVRMRNVIFSIPIDDVREIVSVERRDVVTVRGRQAFAVRGHYIPLACIEDVFATLGVDRGHREPAPVGEPAAQNKSVAAVILQAGERTMGLRVDELLGSQDVVIKSLSENFVDIRGLSGASILGDGNVCLMLDVGAVIELAFRPRTDESQERAT